MKRTSIGLRLVRSALLLGLCLVFWQVSSAQDLPKSVLTALKGHTETIYAVAVTPDGKYVLTASFDKSVRMWDANTGKEIKSFAGDKGHTSLVLCVGLSPDGRTFASGSQDNTAKVWDIPGDTHLKAYTHAEAVNAIALSTDGKLLAGAGKDGTVKLWNPADGKMLFNMTGHAGPVTSVSFSADAKTLISGGSDQTLRQWNTADGKQLGVVYAHAGPATGVRYHPNGTAVSIGDDGLVKFWKLPIVPSRALAAPHAEAVTAMFLSADTLLTGSTDKTIRQWNFANGQLVKAMSPAAAAINDVALAPNNTLIAAATADGKLVLITPADGKIVYDGPAHEGGVSSVAFNTTAAQVFTSGKDGRVRQWALPLKAARTFAHPDAVLAAMVQPDGARLMTGSSDKLVRTWTLANLALEKQYAGHTGPVTAVTMNANGQFLASGSADASIRIWNPATGQPAGELNGHVGAVTSLALHPNGQQLLSTGEDGTIKLWKLPVTPAKALAHPDAVTSAVLSPDGNKVLTGCNDKQVRLWNLAGQAERAFAGLTAAPTSVTFSPNGAQVAAGGSDKSIMIWNAADAAVVKRIENLPNIVQSVALSPDGKTVAGGFADNIIRLYTIADGKEIKPLMGHAGAVTALLYSPKGDLLISGSADKTVQLWAAADGANKGKIDHPAAVTSIAVTRDGSKLATGCADKSARLYTLADSKLQATIATPADVKGVDLSADASRVIVAGADNKARVYAADGKLLEIVNHAGPVNAVAYQPAGTVFVSASADKNVLLTAPAVLWQAAHAGPVRQAVFNAAGNQVFSAADDKSLKQWNAADGKLLKSVDAHAGPVLGVGLSADSTKIVTIGADKALKVWPAALDKAAVTATLTGVPHGLSVAPNGARAAVSFVDDKQATQVQAIDLITGGELQTIRDHKGPVPALGFQADNRTLFSAGADKNVRLTDIGSVGSFEAHPGGVAGMALSNNNVQVLTGGADKTVKLFDTTAGKAASVLKTFATLPEAVTAVAFSRDYTQAGAAAGKTVKVWTVADGKEVATLTHPAAVTSLSFSLDKTKMVTGSADTFTRVWDLGNGQVLELFKQAAPVRAVAFHNNNVNALAGGDDKQVGIHSLSATKVVQGSAAPLRALNLTATGTHALVGGDDMSAYLINTASGAKEKTFAGAKGPIRAVAITKTNTLVAVGGADKEVHLFNFADAKGVGDLKAPATVLALDFSPNNLTLAAGCEDKALLTWNVAFNPGQPAPPDFGKVTGTYAHDAAVTDVLFAADSVQYYSGSVDKSIRAWKFASDAPIKNFAHPALVDAVAFNNDLSLLATGCHDGNLRLWEMAKGQPRVIAAHLKPAANPIYCVAFNKDGSQLVSGSLDQTLKLWDTKTGNLVREFKAFDEKAFPKGHREGVFCASISPDGKTLASGGSDRTIKLWNMDNGEVIRELVNPNIKPPTGALPGPAQSHPGWVYKVQFTDDGKFLVSAGNAPGNKGYLAVWNPADGKLLHAEELPLGPIYALAVSPDKKFLVVGCGPRSPQADTAEAYIIQMPDMVK